MSATFQQRVERLLATLLTSPAALATETRDAVMARAAATGGSTRTGGEVPDALTAFVDKVALHAYKVTDGDFGRLRAVGYSEDQLFEATLSAATGAAWARLDRGLAALRGGR